MPIAIAAVAASAIGAGANIIASNDAASAAKNAANKNIALQTQIYNSNKAALTPFMNAGESVTPNIQALLGVGGDPTAAQGALSQYLNSAGYQFVLGQGANAIGQIAASQGKLNSGGTLKALEQYGQGTASQFFQTYLGDLQQQQGVGLTAASALAGVGQNYAGAVSANNNSAAAASGNAALTSATGVNNLLSGALNSYALNQGLSSYGQAGAGAQTGAALPADLEGLI